MTAPLLSRLRSRGPKRILSLDGGGIRGCATLGYLEHIEADPRHLGGAHLFPPHQARCGRARQARLRHLHRRCDLLGGQAQLSYVRYNAGFEQAELRAAGIEATEKELRSLRDMSAGANADRLYEIGKACAKLHCRRDHFPAGFDPTRPPAAKPGAFSSPLVASSL
jgi:hypothetical protein